MALSDNLTAEKAALIALLEAEYPDQNLRDQLLDRLFLVRSLLGELAGVGGSLTVNGGDASAANQTAVQANAGADASKATAVQGITGGKPVSVVFSGSLPAGTNAIGSITNTAFGINGTLPAFAATPTVNIGTAPNLTITNTAFTANAGLNLNTSGLALESTGNLAALNTNLGAQNDAAATTDTGTFSLVAFVKRGLQNWTSLLSRLPSSLGAKSTATSLSTTSATDSANVLTAAQQTRGANITAYSKDDVYFSVGILTSAGLIAGQSLIIQRFQALINISAIPSGMSLRVLFFATVADAQIAAAYVIDNDPLANVLPTAFPPANGFPLTLTLEGGKVLAQTSDINTIFRLGSGETNIYFYIKAEAAFTSAANSETMNCKAVVGAYT